MISVESGLSMVVKIFRSVTVIKIRTKSIKVSDQKTKKTIKWYKKT